jgi:mitofilin
LRNALDEDTNDESKELQWREVTRLFELQSKAVNEAKKNINQANNSLADLEKLVKEAKSSDIFKNVKSLNQTQIDLIEQERLIKSEENKLAEATIHANVLRSYTNEQKLARAQFLKEIQALQPEGIHAVNRSEDQLTSDEINNLLIHAHKRVLQLQKQIEKMQVCLLACFIILFSLLFEELFVNSSRKINRFK